MSIILIIGIGFLLIFTQNSNNDVVNNSSLSNTNPISSNIATNGHASNQKSNDCFKNSDEAYWTGFADGDNGKPYGITGEFPSKYKQSEYWNSYLEGYRDGSDSYDYQLGLNDGINQLQNGGEYNNNHWSDSYDQGYDEGYYHTMVEYEEVS